MPDNASMSAAAFCCLWCRHCFRRREGTTFGCSRARQAIDNAFTAVPVRQPGKRAVPLRVDGGRFSISPEFRPSWPLGTAAPLQCLTLLKERSPIQVCAADRSLESLSMGFVPVGRYLPRSSIPRPERNIRSEPWSILGLGTSRARGIFSASPPVRSGLRTGSRSWNPRRRDVVCLLADADEVPFHGGLYTD